MNYFYIADKEHNTRNPGSRLQQSIIAKFERISIENFYQMIGNDHFQCSYEIKIFREIECHYLFMS